MDELKVMVSDVEKNSIAEELGVSVGDILVGINGRKVLDLLDYMDLMLNEKLEVELEAENGEIKVLDIEKEVYEDIGITFEPNLMSRPKSCKNKCAFCFIDQDAPNMRDTVYFKDDDWRLSYLYGNYVTFTNVSDEELERICKRHYSPMFLSVHSMRPELRVKLMKNPNAAKIIDLFEKFKQNDIMLNCQFVLCPGINDGEELEYSISKLYEYIDIVDSAAVVPVGLTKFRDGLTPLREYTKDEAMQVLITVHKWQDKALKEHGRRFIFASDEFYIKAEHEVPDFDALEDFAQIENGVGLVTRFAEEFACALEKIGKYSSPYKRIVIATGVSAHAFMSEIAEVASEALNVRIDVLKVENKFFGKSITVAGLLTGGDIAEALMDCGECDIVLLPQVMFRSGTETFLDNVTLSDVAKKTGKKIKIVPVDGECFVNAVCGID